METDEPWGLEDDEMRYTPTDTTRDDSMDGVSEQQGSVNISFGSTIVTKFDRSIATSSYRGLAPADVYKCDQCSFLTGDFMGFIGHKNHHNAKRKLSSSFTCGMCVYETQSPVAMVEHIQGHVKLMFENMDTMEEDSHRSTVNIASADSYVADEASMTIHEETLTNSPVGDIFDQNHNEVHPDNHRTEISEDAMELDKCQHSEPVARHKLVVMVYEANTVTYETSDATYISADGLQTVKIAHPDTDLVRVLEDAVENVEEFSICKSSKNAESKMECSIPELFSHSKNENVRNDELFMASSNEETSAGNDPNKLIPDKSSDVCSPGNSNITDSTHASRFNLSSTESLEACSSPITPVISTESVSTGTITSKRDLRWRPPVAEYQPQQISLKYMYRHKTCVGVRFHGSKDIVVVTDRNLKTVKENVPAKFKDEPDEIQLLNDHAEPAKSVHSTKKKPKGRKCSFALKRQGGQLINTSLQAPGLSQQQEDDDMTALPKNHDLDFSVFEFDDSRQQDIAHNFERAKCSRNMIPVSNKKRRKEDDNYNEKIYSSELTVSREELSVDLQRLETETCIQSPKKHKRDILKRYETELVNSTTDEYNATADNDCHQARVMSVNQQSCSAKTAENSINEQLSDDLSTPSADLTKTQLPILLGIFDTTLTGCAQVGNGTTLQAPLSASNPSIDCVEIVHHGCTPSEKLDKALAKHTRDDKSALLTNGPADNTNFMERATAGADQSLTDNYSSATAGYGGTKCSLKPIEAEVLDMCGPLDYSMKKHPKFAHHVKPVGINEEILRKTEIMDKQKTADNKIVGEEKDAMVGKGLHGLYEEVRTLSDINRQTDFKMAVFGKENDSDVHKKLNRSPLKTTLTEDTLKSTKLTPHTAAIGTTASAFHKIHTNKGAQQLEAGMIPTNRKRSLDRPFACRLCPFRSSRSYNLQIHELVHSAKSRNMYI